MGERNRGVTVFSVVLVIVGVVGAVAVAMYVSRQHSYRTLLLVAAVSFCFTAVVAAGLFLNRKRSAALAMLAVGAGAEFMAARAIVRYRRDYDFVQPRPLAAARHIRAKTNETPKAPAPVAVEVNAAAAATSPPAIKREIPKKAADLLTATPFDFPQFLGRNRSASVQGVHVEREWSQHSPKLLWRQHIAPAWSAFAIVNGYAVTMEQRGNAETVACYELATGQPVWATSVRARYENPDWHEAGVGPRSTPTIDEGKVYTLGAMGHLLCLNGSDGKPIWQKDLLAEYGITPEQEKSDIPFGRANSPLVVKDLVIVPAGGAPGRRISLAAFNKRTGKKIWESGTRQIGYSSPALATLAGKPQVLSVNEDTVSGHDPDTGKLLWEQAWPGGSTGPVNASQAVPVAPNRFFISKSYGGGGALYEIAPGDDGRFTTKEIWKSNRVMRTRFTNVVLKDNYVYGLSDGILECIRLDSGERVWKDGRYGHGQILLLDDSILVLTESGEIVLVDASPQNANKVLGRFKAIEGTSWNNIALSGPYLLVRNANEAACYRIPLAGGRTGSQGHTN